MLTGSLTYGSRIEGVEFENVGFVSNSPKVVLVEVNSTGQGDVTIVVHVEKVVDHAEAEAIGLREATRAINILTVQQGLYASDPGYKGRSLKNDSTGVHDLGSSIGMSTSGYCVKKLGGSSLDSLKAALSDATPPGEGDYQLFRTTLATKDVASRFLALYRMLAHLAGGDAQKKIDALIVKHGGGAGSGNTGRGDVSETIYTKIRNDYMHPDRNIPLSQVRAEMDAYIAGLVAVVQKAMRNP
jgi:hypothetical protein